jgi:large subunit ribosomal protein L19e
MKLNNKKNFIARTLKVGKKRISLVKLRLDEIKEALTKQDVRDLKNEGAIKIKEIKGRKKVKKRKRRGPGKIKKRLNKRKQEYVKITRKLRGYVSELKKQGILKREEIKDIRKKIRNRKFRSKNNLKDYIKGLKNENIKA